MDCSLPDSSAYGIFQARVLEWGFLLQGILLTQESNPGLLHYRQMLYSLSHQGSTILSSVTKIISDVCKMSYTKFSHFNSVTQSGWTLCNPMDCSMPGLPVHHHLLEFNQTHVLSRWCHPTISSSVIPFSSCLQSFPASGSFPRGQFFTSGGQSIGVSASTSVLPMNIQDWFPWGWTGWISLQSKELSRVFSNTTV